MTRRRALLRRTSPSPTAAAPARLSASLSRRGFLAVGGASAAALALAACGGGSSSGAAAASGSPVRGGTLKIAFWDDQQGSIDPNQVYWIESRSLNRNFADSLTDQDPDTGEIVPWLATAWTVNADASSYTFTLRDDVTFSDGTPFDATAVKTAFDGIVALGARSTLGLVYLRGYKSTTVVDPHTVRVDFNGPNAQFLQASSTTTLAILSPATYSKTPEERSAGAVIGSGLFVLDSYTAAQSAVLTRRPDYAWPSRLVRNSGAAYLDRIEVSYIAEDSVRVGSLTAGDIDIAWPRLPISAADQKVITAAGGRIVQRSLPGISDIILPNVTGGRILGDPAVRKALQKAIDRKTYASTVFWPAYPVATSPLDRSTPGWVDLSSSLAYDPDGAGAALDAAGWTAGSGDYRTKGGTPLTLVLITTVSSDGYQLLQDQLKKVGIQLRIDVITAADRVARVKNADFDLVETYLTRGDASVLGAAIDTAVITVPPSSTSQDAATAATVSGYFAQGLSTTDTDARNKIYAELQQYLVDSAVVFPLYDRLQVSGLGSSVQGFAWTSESFLRANDIWKSA